MGSEKEMRKIDVWDIDAVVSAAILLLGHQGRLKNDILALSAIIQIELIEPGIVEAGRWGIQRDAGGFCSDELCAFLGSSEILGDITREWSRSKTIKLTKRGERKFKRIIIDAWRKVGNKQKIIEILKALDVGFEGSSDYQRVTELLDIQSLDEALIFLLE